MEPASVPSGGRVELLDHLADALIFEALPIARKAQGVDTLQVPADQVPGKQALDAPVGAGACGGQQRWQACS